MAQNASLERDSIEAPYRDSSSSRSTNKSKRTSADGTSRKGQIFNGDDERKELLTEEPSEPRPSNARKRRKAEKGSRGRDTSKMIYDRDMEDEGSSLSRESSFSASDASSEADREKMGSVQAQRSSSRMKRFFKYGILNILIAVAFVVIAYGAYRATVDDDAYVARVISNGTHLFAPTTIVVSLDGFRADFLDRHLTPTLNEFIKRGVSPRYMLPSFPSVTFPNHYTMATGLYPESHGVVGNTFWDPDLKEEFYYTKPSAMKPKWWGGEPIWVTAEEQNVKTAIHMWPGSEAHIGNTEPSYLDKFNGDEPLDKKVRRIFELLDKPGPAHDGQHGKDHKKNDKGSRPQLVMAYVPNVDAAGHKFGPNSTDIQESIKSVDWLLARVLDGLNARNLTDIVNVVVVSDHGMATTSLDRLIQFEDLVDPKYFSHTDGWPLYGLRLKDPGMLDMVHEHLAAKAATHPGFDVYLRDGDMPARWHFSRSARIAPLWVVPRAGWAVVTRDEFDVAAARARGAVYHPIGLHGYDHEHALMRAIFVARGPAFPHAPGARVRPFQNTNLYNILCDSLGVAPRPNNGSLRLPLRPVGVHPDEGGPWDEEVSDPEPWRGDGGASATKAKGKATATSGGAAVARPTVDKAIGPQLDPMDPSSWPEWLHDKFDSLKGWLKNVFGGAAGSDAAKGAGKDKDKGAGR